jgi:thiol-disulfide isomerase/thioredoxin
MIIAGLIALTSVVVAPDLAGRPRVIAGDSGVKGSVVIFGLVDCPIVRKYAPELKKLHRDLAEKQVAFSFAIVDPKLEPRIETEFVRPNGFQFLVVGDTTHRLAKQFGVTNVPTAALFDDKGELRYLGRIDDRFPQLGKQRAPRDLTLRKAVDQLLTGQRVVPDRTAVVGCVLPTL